MKKTIHIVAYFLLAIYGFVLLHSIIPHSHHDSGQIESRTDAQSTETSDEFFFFANLLHEHEHQEDNHEMYDEYSNENEVQEASLSQDLQNYFSINFSEKESILVDNTDLFPTNYIFSYKGKLPSSENYRGPPALFV